MIFLSCTLTLLVDQRKVKTRRWKSVYSYSNLKSYLRSIMIELNKNKYKCFV